MAKPNVNAGAYKKRIGVQTLTYTTSASGEKTAVFTTAYTVWGEIVPQYGDEKLTASQVEADVIHLIEMRHSATTAAITPENRLTFNGRYFNIKSVLNVGELNKKLLMTCVEVVA